MRLCYWCRHCFKFTTEQILLALYEQLHTVKIFSLFSTRQKTSLFVGKTSGGYSLMFLKVCPQCKTFVTLTAWFLVLYFAVKDN